MSRATTTEERHPVTKWQRFVLDQGTHPNCPDDVRDRLILANAFLVNPRIDLRRLRRAVTRLQERHDSLRIKFHGQPGGWQAVIGPPQEDIIREIDLGELENAEFLRRIKEIAYAPMPLLASPMAEVFVLHCKGRGDVLVTRVHHAVTDGHGMIILTEDLTKLLIGMPIIGKAVSHAEYINRFETPPPRRAAASTAFWKELHQDFPMAPNVGRKAKGMEPLYDFMGEVDQRKMTITATPESLRRIESWANKIETTAMAMQFSAFLEALCQCYDLDKLIAMTHVSRTNPAMDSYVGDHTLDPIVPYVPQGDRQFEKSARQLRDTISKIFPHLPSDEARRGLPYYQSLIDAGAFPAQFSVYQPRAMARQDRSIFRDGFYTEPGQDQRFGAFTFSAIDIEIKRRNIADMQFDVGSAKEQTGFDIHFDGISFAEGEVMTIANKVCDLLNLEMVSAVQS